MTFDDERLSDEEIRDLCEKAIEQIKKVNTDFDQQKNEIDIVADEKKKNIIIRLAKDLEGKIPINTICMEVIVQLRGYVSESFICKRLDPK